MPVSPDYRPSTRHADLGPAFFDVVAAAKFPRHILRHRNQPWAGRVGLGSLTDAEWIAHFGEFQPLPDNLPQPLALRYHGHQFRHYNPDLGDGRGFLFAQLHDRLDGRLLDLGTKGSGTTPWSRGGDGRLTLKGGVREVLATAMLEAQGVNTSKTFSLIETGEDLVRGDEPSPTRSAVMVRLNHSHIRIGSFQRLSHHGDTEGITRLMDHTIRHHMPAIWTDDLAARTTAFLGQVARNVASMGAGWMAAGFVHGVLNTDNINVTGESFDYGPWRWLPTYQPEFTAAYFDHGGLYAYGRQPETLLWNLARLGGCLLELAPKEALEAALAPFWSQLHADFAAAVVRRLGLQSRGTESDSALGRTLYQFLADSHAPYEQVYYDWYTGSQASHAAHSPNAGFYTGETFAAFSEALAPYQPAPHATRAHPYFEAGTPCTMLIDEVEALWAPIAQSDDWSMLHAKLDHIAQMADAYGTTPQSALPLADNPAGTTTLAAFKGRVLLVVNVASKCGFTPQYEGLQALQSRYHAQGFDVLGFPCDQFGHQEPGTDAEIQNFCTQRFGVTFPISTKIDVNGPRADPLFVYLKSRKGGLLGSAIKWNFTKFLIARNGDVIERFPPTTTPQAIASEIEKALAASVETGA
eukprot:gene5341-5394_t